ncbi:MAG: hypothetical protein AB1758_02620 [Candidatus Eremiobacterota bacterium]
MSHEHPYEFRVWAYVADLVEATQKSGRDRSLAELQFLGFFAARLLDAKFFRYREGGWQPRSFEFDEVVYAMCTAACLSENQAGISLTPEGATRADRYRETELRGDLFALVSELKDLDLHALHLLATACSTGKLPDRQTRIQILCDIRPGLEPLAAEKSLSRADDLLAKSRARTFALA